MSTHPELFAKNPDKDFTRDRKLSFNKLIHLLLGMRGNSISKEIYDYFKNIDEIMTTSAFVQQRDKLLPEALEYIFKEFNYQCEDKLLYEGYNLYAIDGSTLNIATTPNDEDTYIKPKRTKKTLKKGYEDIRGYNQLHLNALYDLMNKTYVDTLIQPIHNINERVAAVTMAKRTSLKNKSIVVMDRGYAALNLFESINRINNLDYVIRVKNNEIVEIRDLPLKELDTTISFQIRTTQTKEDKQLYKDGKAKYVPGPSKFGKDKKDVAWTFESPFDITLRVVRFKINDENYETIITSLNKFEFPLSKIKEIYHLRWGIETSFRELKYAIGLVNFHSKKKEYIIQEIFAKLIMYNFCERITKQVVIKQDNNRKWTYQVNYTMGIHICIDYFRHHSNEPPPDVETLITKYILPIREGRQDERKLKLKSAVFFLYRVA